MEEFKETMAMPYLPAEGESLDDARERYITALRGISVSGCPDDFQQAWNEHLVQVVQAPSVAERWEEAGEIMESGDMGRAVAAQREANMEMKAMMDLWRAGAKYDKASARFLEDVNQSALGG